MDFKTRIKARRLERNLTQDQLGELCNASKSAVSQWESGGTMPSVDTLLLLRDALDCSIDWLLTGTDCRMEDVRLQRLSGLFRDLDERGQDAVFRVAESESAYSVKPKISTKRSA
jgi:transcriptional regulator with XRE-family HTH domain